MLIDFNGHTPRVGNNVLLCEGAKIIGEVSIGDDVSIWFNCVLRGDIHYIQIGKNTNIQDLTTIHVGYREIVCLKVVILLLLGIM